MDNHRFNLTSQYKPTGDQPEAIRQLVEGLQAGAKAQTLLGVTGSGKTFTIANVIQQINRPTLILSHNKTLAAQLYQEFKHFFPDNLVEYFVSYYDYYQPEAYNPTTDVYIEKDLAINEEIDQLRLSATKALLSGRRDVIVISSVSCIYGIGNPSEFTSNTIHLRTGQTIIRDDLLRQLVNATYIRNELSLERGNFRVKGDTVDIFLAYEDYLLRVIFWGDEIEELQTVDPLNNIVIETIDSIDIYPASIFVTTKETAQRALVQIEKDLEERVLYFEHTDRHLEARRIAERVRYDMEMIEQMGYCPGVENYSRYFDGREPGSRPFCLLDYFPNDYLMVIDESHVTVPQIGGMSGGDASRKKNLIEYGFRLPAAADNRPLRFEEFQSLQPQTIYVSATPAEFELNESQGIVVDQVVRPTGLLDPIIDVRPSHNQIDDLIEEVQQCTERNERTLIVTLRKKMAEELDQHLRDIAGIRCTYIHSDIDTLERIQILDDLRKGVYDVLIGVNLLREGLDLPEVSLVIILDADKEGFLRNYRSLTQTAGRAARNLNGKVIMYADTITRSMQATIDETARRRAKQLAYNEKHHITPQAIVKAFTNPLTQKPAEDGAYIQENKVAIAADPIIQSMSPDALRKAIEKTRKDMLAAAKDMEYLEAARLRDEMLQLEAKLKSLTI